MTPPRPPPDRSWKSLLDPGAARDLFDGVAAPSPIVAGRFDRATACFLAELCRLVYVRKADERRTFLRAVGFAEAAFLEGGPADLGFYRPERGDGPTILVFRGTDSVTDWITNLDARQAPWPEGGACHRGFVEAIAPVRPTLLARLSTLPRPHLIAGHSLGGALAMLAASFLRPELVVTFGAPRVGDAGFNATVRGIAAFRVANGRDLVPSLPPGGVFLPAGRLRRVGAARGGPRPRSLLDAVLGGGIGALRASLGEAPEPLSDHSPINYVRSLRP